MAEGWSAGLNTRIVSAAVMAAVAILAIFAGRMTFAVMIAAAGAVLAWEWTRLCGEGRFSATGGVMAAGMVCVIALAALGYSWAGLLALLPLAATVYLMGRARRLHPRWIAAGVFYIGLPTIALVWLRAPEQGERIIFWLMVTVWATDIGAFFAGRLIGGPRLAPKVSPNKTWAGLAGAVVAAAAVGAIASAVDPTAPATVLLATAGAVLAVVAQAGDLGESWVKRRFGAKDSSTLIPGHGGLLDRVDGLLAAAIVLAAWQVLSSGGGVLAWR